MNPGNQLMEAILADPADCANRLVLADWLEDHGDANSLARAQLLRLQVERDRLREPGPGGRRSRRVDRQAQGILKGRPELIGALSHLADDTTAEAPFPVLSVGPALVMFLVADLAAAEDGPLLAGSTWRGELLQTVYEFPTTLWLRTREGNRVSGDMSEDFRNIYDADITGRFYFRGVVAGRSHLAFVTYNVEGNGVFPGLYELHVGRGGWLTGSWWVPSLGTRDGFRLRRRPGG